MIDAIRLFFLIGIAIFGLIAYLLMHNALQEKNGKKVSTLLPHIGNLVDFIYLTRDTIDEKKKSYYRRTLWSFLLSITLFIGIVLTFLVIPWQK